MNKIEQIADMLDKRFEIMMEAYFKRRHNSYGRVEKYPLVALKKMKEYKYFYNYIIQKTGNRIKGKKSLFDLDGNKDE